MLRFSYATVLCLGLCPWALAGNAISVQLTNKVAPGHQPTIEVTILQDLKELRLDIEREDGQPIHQTYAKIPRGSRRSFQLPQKSGWHRYTGKLTVVDSAGEENTMAIEFEATVTGPMDLKVNRADLDLDAHTLLLHANRPLEKVDYQITSDSGTTLGEGSSPSSRPSQPFRVDWAQENGTVLKIVLKAYDTIGLWEIIELTPWSYSIPHEEVVFETGKSEIRPGETPKLDKSFGLLQEGLKKFGNLLAIKLYIAGHTDTVGGTDGNQALSDRRALSIAQYFRKKGFTYPIFYQGFGERALKIPTSDETDEEQNRRAEYILAADPPPMGGGGEMLWKRL